MKNLRLSTIAISLFWPLYSFSLGMGDIVVTSNLDEPFRAEIPLLDLQGASLNSIKAAAANIEDFERVGVDRRDDMLDLLIFKIGRNKKNQPVIFVSSIERFPEPYLELVVDLAWPNGQLYRSYTILLDPPSYSAVKISKSHAVPQNSVIKTSEPGVVNKLIYNDELTRGEIAPISREHKVYGPTHSDETVWQIAQRYTTSDTTLPQVILAIVGTNSRAFTQGNLNGIKPGETLNIPASTDILKVPAKLAKQEVAAHDEAWQNNKEIKHVLLPPYIDAVIGKTQFDPNDNQLSVVAHMPVFMDSEPNKLLIDEVNFITSNALTQSISYLPSVPTQGVFAKSTEQQLIVNDTKNSANSLLASRLQALQKENLQLQKALIEQTKIASKLKLQARNTQNKKIITTVVKPIKEGHFWRDLGLIVLLTAGSYLSYLLLRKKPISDPKDDIILTGPAAEQNKPITDSSKKTAKSRKKTSIKKEPKLRKETQPEPTPLITEAEPIKADTSEKIDKLDNNVIDKKAEPDLTSNKPIENQILPPDDVSEKIPHAPKPVIGSDDEHVLEFEPGLDKLLDEKTDTPGKKPMDWVDDQKIEYPAFNENIDKETKPEPKTEEQIEPNLEQNLQKNNPVEMDNFASNEEDHVGLNLGQNQVGAETLLALAKTYISMGDEETAIQSLNEVVKTGTAAEQSEAQALLADLNKK